MYYSDDKKREREEAESSPLSYRSYLERKKEAAAARDGLVTEAAAARRLGVDAIGYRKLAQKLGIPVNQAITRKQFRAMEAAMGIYPGTDK